MDLKNLTASVKTGGDGLGDGQFEAVVSVFGNVDSYGDVVMPGAFADTLAERFGAGKSFPVVFSHGSGDPANFIGRVIEAEETSEGLHVIGALYDTPNAQHVRRLMADGVLDQFSFAFSVAESGTSERDGKEVTELRRLDLFEVGPTLVGANRETRLVGVKGAKAGRAISAQNEAVIKSARGALVDAVKALDEVLSAVDDGGKSFDSGGIDDEPGGDKDAGASDDPAAGKSDADAVRARAQAIFQTNKEGA